MKAVLVGLVSIILAPQLQAGFEAQDRLVLGVVSGFPEWIDEALQEGADINGYDSEGQLALHIAIRMENPDMYHRLLSLGADPKAKDSGGNTALHWAVYHERDDVIIDLFARDVDVNAQNRFGGTPLHLAVSKRAGGTYPYKGTKRGRLVNAEITKLLIANGAKTDSRAFSESYEFTPLFVCVQEGHIDAARILLEQGANAVAKDSRGVHVLDLAAAIGTFQFIGLLIEFGADPNAEADDDAVPLSRAFQAGKVENVAALIKHGATTEGLPDEYLTWLGEWRGEHGETFAHIAVRHGGVRAVDFAIDHKMQINAFDDRGWAPLHVAASGGRKDEAVRLLEGSAFVDRQEPDHDTPLIVAAEWGQEDIVALLLDWGADPNLQGRDGLTALHMAAKGSVLTSWLFRTSETEEERKEKERRYALAVLLLLEAGSDTIAKNDAGRTPYEEAVYYENNTAAQLLKR